MVTGPRGGIILEMDRYSNLPQSLSSILTHFSQNPAEHVPNPTGCKKRASVALILRIRPKFSDTAIAESAAQGKDVDAKLQDFFAQPWVKDGIPEVLFIKRIDRSGDRWSGHVALPGGRRDPEDANDQETAIRETREEVGLDLTAQECIPVGSLPERIITTTWGHQVLMVICPYMFLWTSSKSPSLKLQPAEIAATHWVPLAALLSPSLRTQQLADFSDRLFHQRGAFVKTLARCIIGKMSFSAIRLIPSESLFSTTPSDFDSSEIQSRLSNTAALSWLNPVSSLLSKSSLPPTSPPLHLWGLTLGILADFLDQFPPHDAVKLWTYPTFTPPDLQFLIWIMTYSKRQQNARSLNEGSRTPARQRRYSTGPANQTAVDATTAALAVEDTKPGISAAAAAGRNHAIGALLDGYYDRIKVAMIAFLVWRTFATSATTFGLIRWLARGRKA